MPPKRKSDRAAGNAAKKAKQDTSKIEFNLEWKEEGELKPGIPELIYLDGPDATQSSKVAGFDIDFTIIKTKSGRKFATGPSDWVFLYDCVPQKLRDLNKAGTKIAFFTNQMGIEKGKQDVKSLIGKFEDIINDIGIPIQVFISTGSSHFRKPSIEMWKFMEENCNGGTLIDLKEPIYVGDAAGRAKNWAPGKPKDFSATDRMFAANIGCAFATPEAFFLGEPEAKFEWRSLCVEEFLASQKGQKAPEKLHSDSQEVVILVGSPASGKSTIRERYFSPNGYKTINRDTLGTKEKCIKVAGDSLKAGESIIIDNTNPAKANRKPYIELAKKYKVPVRCFFLKMDTQLSYHLNMFRQNQSKGKRRRIPEVAYRTYEKYFEQPELIEGFDSVQELEFIPQFDSKSDEELFRQWTSM